MLIYYPEYPNEGRIDFINRILNNPLHLKKAKDILKAEKKHQIETEKQMEK